MSRMSLTALAVCLMACGDQTSVAAPDQPSDFTPNDNRTAIELDGDFRPNDEARTALSGGATTVFDVSIDAFSLPAPNLRAGSLPRRRMPAWVPYSTTSPASRATSMTAAGGHLLPESRLRRSSSARASRGPGRTAGRCR
jgi:hypothetical protein